MVCLGVRVHAYIYMCVCVCVHLYILILLLVFYHHQTLSLNNNMANGHLYTGRLSPAQATHTYTHQLALPTVPLPHVCNKLVTVGPTDVVPMAVIIATLVQIIPLKSLQCMSLQVQ